MPSPVLNLIIRSALDRDALTFCSASGAADKSAINAWVKGIKGLGLWNSIACWPLRSSQNAGAGTTAYSLGGLGTYNGTLTSGPTWTADGVVNSSTTPYIEINPVVPSSPYPAFMFAAFKVDNTTTDPPQNNLFLINETTIAATVQNLAMSKYGNNYGLPATLTTMQSCFAGPVYPPNVWHTQFGTIDSTNMKLYIDTTLIANVVRTGTAFPNYGKLKLAVSCPGTFAFSMLSTGTISAATSLTIRELYKSTLGAGLGLP